MVDPQATMSALESQIMHGLATTDARVSYIKQICYQLETLGKQLVERDAYTAKRQAEEAQQRQADLDAIGAKKGDERLIDADYATQQAYLEKYGNDAFAARITRERKEDRDKGIIRRW